MQLRPSDNITALSVLRFDYKADSGLSQNLFRYGIYFNFLHGYEFDKLRLFLLFDVCNTHSFVSP